MSYCCVVVVVVVVIVALNLSVFFYFTGVSQLYEIAEFFPRNAPKI